MSESSDSVHVLGGEVEAADRQGVGRRREPEVDVDALGRVVVYEGLWVAEEAP